MKKEHWVILLILSNIIFIQACEKLFDKITISGMVTDQVTKQPIEGAIIYLGDKTDQDDGVHLQNIRSMDITNKDGSYRFKIPESDYSGENFHLYPVVYAMKDGYPGSSIHSILDNNYNNNIELYHPAKLILRVWNDTVRNNCDNAILQMSARQYRSYPHNIGASLMGHSHIETECSGRTFDTIFEFNTMWGNMQYSLYFSPTYCSLPRADFTIMPDSTLNLSLSF
jgi:hypothetical protein